MSTPGGTVVDDERPAGDPRDDEAGGSVRGSSASSLLGDADLADVVVAGAVLFLLTANAPGQLRGSPILFDLVLWPLGAVGLVGLAVLARRGDAPARWGAAFLAWALVATVASDQPLVAFAGSWFGDRGWIFLAAYVGCWAVGRRRGWTAVRVVTGALVLGLALGALLALLQTTGPDEGSELVRLQSGRTPGFTVNPVYFGALMSGGVALVSSLAAGARHARWWGLLPLLTLLAAGVGLSGSRIAFAGAIGLGLAAAWRGRGT